MVLERRDLELENEQHDDDGEHAIAEGLDARKPHLPVLEPLEQAEILDLLISRRTAAAGT